MVDEVQEKRIEEHYAPQSPSPQRSEGRGGRGFTMAVILIALGVGLLLDNIGVVSINWWGLLRYWPVLLILSGLDLLIGRRSMIGSAFVALIGLAVVIGLLLFSGSVGDSGPAGETISGDFSEPLGDVESVEAVLNLGATETTVRAISGGDEVASGSYTTDEGMEIIVDYTPDGDTGHLTISQSGEFSGEDFPFMSGPSFMGEIDLGLTDAVPLSLIVDSGVGTVILDLSGLKITALEVNAGVGNLEIILPSEGSFSVTVDGGVGNVSITVPSELGVRVNVDRGIGNLDISERFDSTDEDEYETENYDSADNRVEMELHLGVGNVELLD